MLDKGFFYESTSQQQISGEMADEGSEVKSAGPSSPRSSQSSSTGGKPSSPHSPRQPRRVKLTQQQLDSLTKDELAAKWHEQDLYVECLEAQAAAQEGTEITRVRPPYSHILSELTNARTQRSFIRDKTLIGTLSIGFIRPVFRILSLNCLLGLR